MREILRSNNPLLLCVDEGLPPVAATWVLKGSIGSPLQRPSGEQRIGRAPTTLDEAGLGTWVDGDDTA